MLDLTRSRIQPAQSPSADALQESPRRRGLRSLDGPWFLSVLLLCSAVGLGLPGSLVQGEEATRTIVDGVILPAGPAYTLGDLSAFSSLLVTNGGRQTNAGILLGNTATAHTNLAVVSGVGSALYSTAALTVGNTGAFNKVVLMVGARPGRATWWWWVRGAS
jgi:hypothetical protein